MKLPHLHPVSFLLGAAGGLAFLMLSSQAGIPAFPSGRFTFGPHPRDFVTIREGQPLTVPAGRVFVPTAIGGGVYNRLVVDGTIQFSAQSPFDVHPGPCLFSAVPGPMVFQQGQLVAAEDNDTASARAKVWGYLASDATSTTANPIYPRIEFAPRPSDGIAIHQGTPFTVPQGKVFVLTSLGRSAYGPGSGPIDLNVDGVGEVSADLINGAGGTWSSTGPVPTGFAAQAGSLVEVTCGNPFILNGVAWGYLADV